MKLNEVITPIDKQYFLKMHEERKFVDTCLLTELLVQTYYYSANEYNNMNCDKLIDVMKKPEPYSKREIDLIKQNAIKLLAVKYNVKVDSIEPLKFRKENYEKNYS